MEESTVDPEGARRNLDNEGESGENESDAGSPDNSRIPFPETRRARASVLDAARSGTPIAKEEAIALHGAIAQAVADRARGIGVEVSVEGAGLSNRTSFDRSGRIVIHLPQAGATDRAENYDNNRRPFVQSSERAAQEELIHAAYLVGFKEEWDGRGSFIDFVNERSAEEISGFRDSLDSLSESDALKAGVLLLWEPSNPAEHGLGPGQKYIVANGHHRYAFGNRQGVAGFNSQIVREEDGVTAGDAMILAAEVNIADGKGTIYDQARSIRNTAAERGKDQALAQAARVGARGRKAARIALNASDPLYEAFVNERVEADSAAAIAEAAPGNEGAQRVGIRAATEGQSPQFAANMARLKEGGINPDDAVRVAMREPP
ncbi:MAG: hypothetical protein WD342_04300 [Verrucomicrobiales bacterium]